MSAIKNRFHNEICEGMSQEPSTVEQKVEAGVSVEDAITLELIAQHEQRENHVAMSETPNFLNY